MPSLEQVKGQSYTQHQVAEAVRYRVEERTAGRGGTPNLGYRAVKEVRERRQEQSKEAEEQVSGANQERRHGRHGEAGKCKHVGRYPGIGQCTSKGLGSPVNV